MVSTATRVAIVAAVIGWLPYLLLRGFWAILLANVSGASHGEVSGPILFFLPRLFWCGVAITAIVMVAWALRSLRLLVRTET